MKNVLVKASDPVKQALLILNHFCLAILFCSTTTTVIADELEVSLSDAMVDLRHGSDFDQDFVGRLAIMISEDDEASQGRDVENTLLSYTFDSRGSRGDFDISLGGRAFFMDLDVEDSSVDGSGLGIALGGGIGAELAPNFSARLEVFYSPDILTGGDLDSTLDSEFRLSYQVIDNGVVFVGYRLLRAEIDDDEGDVYDGGLIGLRLLF